MFDAHLIGENHDVIAQRIKPLIVRPFVGAVEFFCGRRQNFNNYDRVKKRSQAAHVLKIRIFARHNEVGKSVEVRVLNAHLLIARHHFASRVFELITQADFDIVLDAVVVGLRARHQLRRIIGIAHGPHLTVEPLVFDVAVQQNVVVFVEGDAMFFLSLRARKRKFRL